MKKIVAIVVAIVLCMSIMAVSAMADGGQVSLSSNTVTRGNQVTLNISVSGGVEFAFLKLRISYDKSALKIVGSASSLGGLSFTQGNPNNPTYTPVWSGPANVSADGVIASITFEALADAAKGSYTIGVSVEECYNQTFEDVSLAGGAGTITITIPPCASHTWDEGVVTKAASCEESGVKTYTCTVCQETRTEDIPSLGGHTWDNGVVTKAAACEAKGVKTYTCSVCQTTRTEEIPATGHSWDNGAVTKAATCEAKGVKTYTCTACKATRTEEIPATGHSWDNGAVTKAATCEAKGVKTYTCTACRATRTEEIPATGHSWDNGTVTKAATCEDKGVKTYTCTACQATKTEEIPSLGGHKWGVWTPVQGEDVHSHACEVCQKVEKETHEWDDGKVTKPATCSTDGEKTFSCTICAATRIEPIPATGEHDYTDHYEYTEGEDVHYGFCACGEKGPAEVHQYTQEGDILEKPTATKEGKQEKLCVCGAKTVVTLAKTSGEYDHVPKTGDITGQVVLFGVVCLLGIGGAAYLVYSLRRKNTF